MTSFNLHITVCQFISCTQYHMKYIDTKKYRTTPFVSTLPLIPFSCVNTTVFDSCQVFDEIISFFSHDAFHVGVKQIVR